MKYLKTFENIDYKYQVNDYVLLDKENFIDNISKKGQIIEIDYEDDKVPYFVKIIGKEFWVTEGMIIRNLTTEEIEQYEFENTRIVTINKNHYIRMHHTIGA